MSQENKKNEKIRVNFGKEIIVCREWVGDKWMWRVKKYSLFLGIAEIPGWSDEGGFHTTIKNFSTKEQAMEYANKLKENYLDK